ncbi:DMT family protein [Caulobacter sp. NIBR2454]|uniref:DMT family protein n=1 Tax=Caulobacter sp. NIBR2454 TaxID=3015996 RepID=UPI0022B660FA|nr:DMT family protein [Caulobacter sp. NIBR2454]
MSASLWPKILPVVMLAASNIFMTFAWYGHLKHRTATLFMVILTSWMIALPEYMLAVPANRIGSTVYSPGQLKAMQEAITLIVFVIFSALYLGEPVRWTTLVGFGFIFVGALFIFLNR